MKKKITYPDKNFRRPNTGSNRKVKHNKDGTRQQIRQLLKSFIPSTELNQQGKVR